MLSGDEHYKGFEGFEEQESDNKCHSFLHHKFYTTHRTVLETVATITYAEAIKPSDQTRGC